MRLNLAHTRISGGVIYLLSTVLFTILGIVALGILEVLYLINKISSETCIVALTALEVIYIYLNGLVAERTICKGT